MFVDVDEYEEDEDKNKDCKGFFEKWWNAHRKIEDEGYSFYMNSKDSLEYIFDTIRDITDTADAWSWVPRYAMPQLQKLLNALERSICQAISSGVYPEMDIDAILVMHIKSIRGFDKYPPSDQPRGKIYDSKWQTAHNFCDRSK